MAYKHGIYGREVATSLMPMTQINAGLPVVFGEAARTSATIILKMLDLAAE